ncbi:type II toxin-antitoxin system RelE/ParE family toxin [Flavobacterium crocinum]|uniref:Type II toxin-antitoxin system RelE/ParE family toxin n=1 Tax=Flavobacterium crocinum TaxID=2183896 RepID=A0A2S1YIY8_9FLAO|nr:type II toxin-antitoxin system RelE/ParE family toxin [Flavobacterium crocinum]AWK04025.1 type II toxin-antitoxin system RelE/ParE family toxin [Flavobacterium crocinum]
MRRIVFSGRSKFQLEQLLEYLEIRFSLSTRDKFIANFYKIIETIRLNPDTFPLSSRNKTRRCVISKQTTLYYKYNTQEVRLLSLFDTRQNPNKIKKDIK